MTTDQLSLLFNSQRFRVLTLVCEAGQLGTTQTDIAKAANISVDAVAVHLQSLMNMGVVGLDENRQYKVYYGRPGPLLDAGIDADAALEKLIWLCNKKKG